MHWFLERDVWPEREAALIDACRPHGAAWLVELDVEGCIVGRRPQVDGPVVGCGSKTMLLAIARYGWRPGGWFGGGFDVASYARGLGPLYLNNEARVISTANVSDQPEQRLFLRPLDDDKAFTGAVFETEAFASWIAQQRAIGYLGEDDFEIAAAPVAKLGDEWRVVIVDGRAVSGCRYRPDEATALPENVQTVAEEAAARYQPAPVFVVDIAETDAGLKVVEYNAFNSADLYACEIPPTIDAIAELLGRSA